MNCRTKKFAQVVAVAMVAAIVFTACTGADPPYDIVVYGGTSAGVSPPPAQNRKVRCSGDSPRKAPERRCHAICARKQVEETLYSVTVATFTGIFWGRKQVLSSQAW